MQEDQRQIEISSTQSMYRARAFRSLRRPLLLTRLGMLCERVARAFWPFWSVLFLIWAAVSFRLADALSVEIAWMAVLVSAVAVAVTLGAGLRRFRWPGLTDAADRLDRSLKGRPLTALWDRQAIGTGDAASTFVWREHLSRMSAEVARARWVRPDLRLSARDPFGLRYVAATALVAALLFGSGGRDATLSALGPSADATVLPTGPIFEGWIEPPRYTGLPTIYLNDIAAGSSLSVPVGARVTLRLYGQVGAQRVVETLSGMPPVADGAAPEGGFDFDIVQNGDLTISGDGKDDLVWSFTTIADLPPEIAVTGPVERTPAGEMQVPFEAADDYGVASAKALLSLDMAAIDRRHGLALDPEDVPEITLDLPMPYSGGRTGFTEILTEDLSKHPWVGLPVILHMTALDDPGQSGAAEPEAFPLPGRRFFDPLARAIVEQRRDLLWNRANAPRVAQVLRAVSHLPEDIFDSERAYLLLRTGIRRLESAGIKPLGDQLRDEVAEILWQTALRIEDGNLGDAAERLKRAQERLADALKNGATDEEIAELTDELRRAMQEYLEQMAREAEQNPENQQSMGEMEQITSDQLQDMLDQIEELFKEGRTEEAMELLEQLRQMMENIQTAQRQQGPGQQGQQTMREMQDTLRQQQDLTDESFRRLQDQFNGQSQPGDRPNSGRPGANDTDNGRNQTAPSPQELARRQEALRDLLESQRNGLPGADSDEGRAAREALRRAERAMGESRDSLNRGDLPQALEDQADALESLREGLENLGEEMARNQNPNAGRQGDQAGSPDPNSNRDPLGRQAGSVGRLGSEESLLNGEDPYMRSRELLEEIRRRAGERQRPKIELDYLKRLLDRF